MGKIYLWGIIIWKILFCAIESKLMLHYLSEVIHLTPDEFIQLKEPYVNAEITTIYLRTITKPSIYTHVLSIVELIPESQMQSKEILANKSDVNIGKKLRLVVQRSVCGFEQAQEYFFSMNYVTLPKYERKVKICELTMEPIKGTYTIPYSGFHNKSFENVLPRRGTGYRACARIDASTSVLSYLAELNNARAHEYQAKICSVIDHKLGTNLSDYNEYLGGIVLAAQNPYAWSIDNYGGVAYNRQFQLMPRKNQSIAGMKLLFYRTDAIGTVFTKNIIADSPVIDVPLPYDMNELRLMIWDKHDNLLEDLDLRYFGKEDNGTIQEIVEKHETKRSFAALERQKEFVYFISGESERATKTIRDIMHRARSSLIICDPYLRGDILQYFVYTEEQNRTIHIPPIKLDVALITSQNAFKKHSGDKWEIDITQLRIMTETLDVLRRYSFIVTVTCYVLDGYKRNNGKLHDRYIIRDGKEAWSLGSSLNGYGSRDTMLVKLPRVSLDRLTNRVIEWKQEKNRFEVYYKEQLDGIVENRESSS
jgi:hypothetical protein